jgi:hypothetical protein
VNTSARVRPRAWTDLRADFAAHPPDIFVDTEVAADDPYALGRFPALDVFVRANYELVASIGDARIYRVVPRDAPEISPGERLTD